MISVAIVVLSAGIGGAESVVKQIVSNYSNETIKIYLLTTKEDESYFKDCQNIDVVSVGNMSSGFRRKLYSKCVFLICSKVLKKQDLMFYWQMKPFMNKIKKILKRKKIDVIHAHLLHGIYCISKINTTAKKIYTIHDAHGLDNMGFAQNDKVNVGDMYRTADCVTSACNYFFRLFKENGILLNKPVIIPNGIDNKTINSIMKEKNNTHFEIVFLGGDRIVKGCDYLLDAIKICTEKYNKKNILVHVLRSVSVESEFFKSIHKYKLEQYFDLVGYVKGNVHLKYIANSDLFILPSRTEGIANTLLEAIGLHKPIIATSVGGTPEIIQDGVNGYLVPCDANAIAEKICFLIDHPDVLIFMQKQNEKKSKEFSWDRISKQYFDLYQSILG